MADKSIFKVMFCGPADVEPERLVFSEAVQTCSTLLETAQRIVALLPVHWRSDPVIQGCKRGQAAINEQLVGRADALVAVFHSRLGSPTGIADSGTVEEIDNAIARGIPWRAYFYNGPLPAVSDTNQLQKVNEYKKRLQERDFLTPEYVSPTELLLDLLKWLFKVFYSEVRTPNDSGKDELNNMLRMHDFLSKPRARQLANVLYTVAGTETDALRTLACIKPRTLAEYAQHYEWKVKVYHDRVLRNAVEDSFFDGDTVDEDTAHTMWQKIVLPRSKKQPERLLEAYVLFDDTELKTVYLDDRLRTELDELLKRLR